MWPFTSTSPALKAVNRLGAEYDFIVVGGGTAGCVLARRLSEHGRHTVLLVERGNAGDSWFHRTPLLSLHHMSDGNHSTVFDSAVDPRLGFGRADSLITGRGLGGSSRINGGQYTVGAAGEFNAWAAGGREGWAYEEMKTFLVKSQAWNGAALREWHGLEGPIQVRTFEGYQFPVSEQAAEAMARLGFPSIDDMHSPLDPGIGWNKMQFALDPDGTRSSAFRAYLPRSFLESPSCRLDICTNAVVGKLVLDGQGTKQLRAAAVEIHSVDGRHVRIVKAKCEIVLAAGALQTPKILLLSVNWTAR